MVCEWGMSDLGPVALGGNGEPVFLGRDFTERSEYSDETARRIDAEIERLVDDDYKKATEILTERREVLERLAHELLELESLDGGEVYTLIEEMTGFDFAPAQPEPEVEEDPGEAPDTAAAASEAEPEDEPEPGAPGPEPLPAPST